MVSVMNTRRLFILMVLLLAPYWVVAQGRPELLSSQRLPVTFTVSAYYQQFDLGAGTISQQSAPISLGVPLGLNTHVGVRISQASVTSDLATVSGVNDLKVTLSHALRLSDQASLVGGLRVNVPTGATAFDKQVIRAVQEVGRNKYSFQVPAFGLGLGVAPNLVLAYQASDQFVIGLGVSYLYKGSYEPVEGLSDYDPGDEILLSLGFDVALDRLTTFSIDVSGTLYGGDTNNGNPIFEPGTKVMALAQYRKRGYGNDLRLWARYRTQADSEALVEGFFSPVPGLTPPAVAEAHGVYQQRLTNTFWVALNLGFRSFSEVADQGRVLLAQENLFRVGLNPTLRVSPNLTLFARALYMAGTTSGFDGGAGLSASF